MRFRNLAVAGMMAFVLAGCGGGGGGGYGGGDSGSPVYITFSPTSISTTYSKSGGPYSVTVTASVSNPPTSGTVYVYIVADSAVFAAGPQTVTANGNGTYSATLPFNGSAANGTYTGVLTLKLCKDSSCSSQYTLSGGTLAYSVIVTA